MSVLPLGLPCYRQEIAFEDNIHDEVIPFDKIIHRYMFYLYIENQLKEKKTSIFFP